MAKGESFESFQKRQSERLPGTEMSASDFSSTLEREHGYQIEAVEPVNFAEAEYGDVPGLTSIENVLLDSIVNRCKALLVTPMLRDRFGGDHAARRAFQHEMEQVHGAAANRFFQNNVFKKAFSISIISELLQLDELLVARAAKSETVTRLHELVAQLPLQDANTDEERAHRVREMRTAARNVLELLHAL